MYANDIDITNCNASIWNFSRPSIARECFHSGDLFSSVGVVDYSIGGYMQRGYMFFEYDNKTVGKLYNTNVCVVNATDKTFTLDNGGWRTKSTKKAINNTLEVSGIKAMVFQKDWEWYILINGTKHDFVNGGVYAFA